MLSIRLISLIQSLLRKCRLCGAVMIIRTPELESATNYSHDKVLKDRSHAF